MVDFATLRTTMVDTQVRPSDVTKYPVIEAMLEVPRELFVPPEFKALAYAGEDIPLADRRVVLEPRTIAKMLDTIDLRPSELVLDVGCGYGYSSALAARMAQAVVALEDDPERAREAQQLLAEIGADNVAVETGPLTEGAPRHGPYDAILIEGGIEELPAPIAEQLKEGGRIAAIFMEGALGTCRLGVKVAGHIDWRYAFNATAPVLPGFESAREFAL